MAPFAAKPAAATRALRRGPGSADDSAVGPLVSATAKRRVIEAIDQSGLRSDFGTAAPDGAEWEHGNWLQPQFIRVDDPTQRLAREELFAPVLVAMQADSLDHAIALANDTTFGLSASLFTRDLHAAFEYIRRIEVGLVRVNGDTTGVDLHAPFGGLKGSSSGSREQGRAARDFYTEIRTVQIHA
jgi:aldehyde dehydrogenase (NAD+)